jgi:hypothetical protein
MENEIHLENWSDFVNKIADMFNEGSSEQDISKSFSGSKVTWTGQVADIKLDAEYSPGVAINMSPKQVKLKKNKILRCGYIFLDVPEKNKLQWTSCSIGDNVRFTGIISKTYGPFPEIRLSVDERDPEVLLMMSLYNCEFVGKGNLGSVFGSERANTD